MLLILAACGEPEPIPLGFVGGVSGRVADLGLSGRDGALFAIEQHNAAGGIDGRLVQLLVRDDHQDPDAARRAVTDLIDRDVAAVIGPMTSAMAMATVPLVDRHRLLMVSPTVTTSRLTGKDDFFFRVIGTTREYARENAGYQYRIGIRRVAAVLDAGNAAYSRDWMADYRQAFEQLGGTVVAELEFVSSSGVDFLALARQLLDYRADGILVIANSLDAALICQQIRKLDREVRLAASEWAATERLISLGGRAVEGIIIAQFFDRADPSPAYQRFRAAYQQRYGRDPGFEDLAGYDAANVVLEALARRPDGHHLKQVMLDIGRFRGAQGWVEIDRFGDSHRPTYVTTVRDGRFVVLER